MKRLCTLIQMTKWCLGKWGTHMLFWERYHLLTRCNILSCFSYLLQYYKEAIQADPEDGATYCRYALFLEQINDLELADQNFLKSLEVNPADKTCLNLYADFLNRRCHYQEATKFYELARTYSKASSIKEETIFENERRTMFGKEYSKENLLISDTRSAWSSKKDTPSRMVRRT